jgi:4-hydroxy-3-methylbut-2-en-1-yl diphosphate reductase
MLNIEIDKKSGFCFGVVNAISKAEEELAKGETLYCLGDIVHNGQEVERLTRLGLITIDHEQFEQLHNVKVLLRAHGEPPRTYQIAKENNLTLIDASCPVVLKLQSRIKKAYQSAPTEDTQIVIYGKKGHAEVNGLVGQTNEEAIVIESEADLNKLDFSKNICLFSQTTKSLDGFNHLVTTLSERIIDGAKFEFSDTICRQVANRIPNITTFAKKNDIIIFVSGKKSSNGKVLYEHSKKINPNTYFVTEADEVSELDLDLTKKIGICGATSTPRWLMEDVADRLNELALNKEIKEQGIKEKEI